MKDNVEITYRDAFSEHLEQVVHNLMDDGEMPGFYTWPKPDITLDNWQNKQIVVAKVNGIVAGRAVLSCGYYPFLEFENLFVDPDYRGQGVGSRILQFAINQAAEKGYMAIHLQTELSNRGAQHLYVKNGFVPATQGQNLRMLKFLFYPVLSQFQRDHPLALLQSRKGMRSSWELCWQDAIRSDFLRMMLSGGSAQSDSNGYGPGVAGLEINDQDAAFTVEVSGPDEVGKGSEFEVRIKLCNMGSNRITGDCRLLLNAGFMPTEYSDKRQVISIEPDSQQEIILGIRLMEPFNDDIMKVLTYRSVAIVVEFLIEKRVFWLSHEVKVSSTE